MFKTISECRLELVAHSVRNAPRHLLGAEDDPLKQAYFWPSEQDMDIFPCSAARVSFGNEDKTGVSMKADEKLMKYLADHEHLTPFEYNHATFLIECPLFIRSQIHRHRTFSFNEISRRYTEENLEFWIPDKWRKQSDSNRQASTKEEVDPNTPVFASSGEMHNQYGRATVATQYLCITTASLRNYEELLKVGVSREQARAVLPQSLLTKFFMGGNLRNWAHFLRLRLDEHAQYEVRVVAERVKEALLDLWPTAAGVLLDE